MEDEQSSTSPSLKNKLKQSLCLSCCLPYNRRETLDSSSSSSSSSDDWPRLPEIRNKCRHLISRIARRHHHHRRSVDFSYDPLSYALNFDDDAYYLDEAPLRNFSARVRASPPLKTVPQAANVAEGDRLHLVIAYLI